MSMLYIPSFWPTNIVLDVAQQMQIKLHWYAMSLSQAATHVHLIMFLIKFFIRLARFGGNLPLMMISSLNTARNWSGDRGWRWVEDDSQSRPGLKIVHGDPHICIDGLVLPGNASNLMSNLEIQYFANTKLPWCTNKRYLNSSTLCQVQVV